MCRKPFDIVTYTAHTVLNMEFFSLHILMESHTDYCCDESAVQPGTSLSGGGRGTIALEAS